MRRVLPDESVVFQVQGFNPITGATFMCHNAKTLKEARQLAKGILESKIGEKPTHVTITKIVEYLFQS